MSWEAALDPWTCWLVTLTLAHVGWIGLVVAGLAAVGDRLDRSPSAGRRCRLHFGALLILGLTLPATFEVVRRTTPRPVEDASSSVTMPEPSRPEARSTTAPFRPAAGDEPLVAPGGTAPRPARSNAIRDVTVLVRSTSEAAAARRTGAGAMLRASAPFIAVMYALGVVVLLRRPGGGRRRRSDGLRRLALAVAELQLGGERATPAVSALDGRRRSELRRRIGRLLELADEPAIRLTRAGGLALIVLVGLTVGLSAALLSAQDGPGPRGQRNAAKDADTPKAVPAQRQSPSEPVVAIKAVPLATFTVHTIDSHGQPAKAWDRGYVLYGQLNGEPWNTQFHGKPGRPDVLMARVPIGLREVGVYCQSDNVWWTWSPGTPRVSHDAVGLTVVDGDRPEIHVQRMKSALLEIRLQVKSGNLTQEPSVFVSGPQSGQPSDAPGQAQYPAPPPVFGAPGSQSPGIVAWRPLGRPRLRASAPGIFRLDEELLPGRETVVHVDAPGHRNLITRPFQFTEEGQQGVVEITLEPRLRSQNSLKRLLERGAEPVLVPVTLKGPDGNPIPQPAIPRKPVSREGPYRSIGCRAIDQSTGRPVAGAAVTFAVQQKPDDARVPVF
ncbi:MAG TPA: hypothetical protein VKA15_08615, partial [Isosphaeraceae bacterium]|nr:hypothetical protein [Isosphaeraceae bacterium]